MLIAEVSVTWQSQLVSVGYLIGWLSCQLDGQLVSWSNGYLICWFSGQLASVGYLICWSDGELVSWFSDRFDLWSDGLSLSKIPGQKITWRAWFALSFMHPLALSPFKPGNWSGGPIEDTKSVPVTNLKKKSDQMIFLISLRWCIFVWKRFATLTMYLFLLAYFCR